ncbi:hypothetical protein Ddc_18168 [Ditylenchus destructor]|nr:hypothetical protein Ddc_18168 [Ditylenchus destructor]
MLGLLLILAVLGAAFYLHFQLSRTANAAKTKKLSSARNASLVLSTTTAVPEEKAQVTSSAAAYGNCLQCHQGQMSLNQSVSNQDPAQCLNGARSCFSIRDAVAGIVVRGCQSMNCTKNGVISTSDLCYEDSSISYSKTTATYCCCYEDGCNAEAGTVRSEGGGLMQSVCQEISSFVSRIFKDWK